jgi:hypothetical protein
MIESLCLISAKFSCESKCLLDSYFSHALILCTIQGFSKVHFFFLSDFLRLKILMRDFFCKMVKLTNSLVEPKT